MKIFISLCNEYHKVIKTCFLFCTSPLLLYKSVRGSKTVIFPAVKMAVTLIWPWNHLLYFVLIEGVRTPEIKQFLSAHAMYQKLRVRYMEGCIPFLSSSWCNGCTLLYGTQICWPHQSYIPPKTRMVVVSLQWIVLLLQKKIQWICSSP